MQLLVSITAVLAATSAHEHKHNMRKDKTRNVFRGNRTEDFFFESIMSILKSEPVKLVASTVLPSLFHSRFSGETLKTLSCLGALGLSDFALPNTESFVKWFDDDSEMTLSQTGTYVGLADIKEYITFIYGPYFNSFKDIREGPTQFFTENSRDSEECTISVLSKRQIDFNTTFYDAGCLEVVSGITFTYELTRDDSFIKIKKMNLWFPAGYISNLGDLLHKDKLAKFVCSTMEDSCKEEWDANNFASQESCEEEFLKLPHYEGDNLWVDGKTQGCRMVHSTFAGANPSHCPHISLKPIEDINGLIKCQTSTGVEVTDLFTDTQLSWFKDTATNVFGFDYTMHSYVEGSCYA